MFSRKPKKPASILGSLKLTDIPDIGTGTTKAASSSGSLSFADLQKAVQEMKADQAAWDAQRRMQQKYSQLSSQQALMNQYAQQQQNSLQSQLGQLNNQLLNNLPRGAGKSMALGNLAGAPWSGGNLQPIGSPTPKPMNPPKYLAGYRVYVRSGKTVWTVERYDEHSDPYSGQPMRLYYLRDDGGRETRENENDLKIADAPVSAKARVDFDSVVIEDHKRAQILEALEQINQSDLIFQKWGFSETIEKGKGVSMLFYGPPGTGKTLMAQAIANKLDYTLKVISTADVESSAPGEAERNIRKHFSEAKGGKVVLLFDECDSLIYDRKDVGAIMGAQINELLSQIERFEGITLFTTNRLGTLDEAVNRRLALKLEFSMPTPEQRAEIWRRMFPKQCPLDKHIDWPRLASIDISGGYIKNAVLRAARMAAIEKVPDDKKKITMKHLIKALALETSSMIDFEAARTNQRRGIGRIVRTSTGNRIRTEEEIKQQEELKEHVQQQ